ncbi:hypothetical protein ACI3L3_05795 [Desulfobaculum sp. SPO524]|uniref:hypothetical protein n=1 Tax=Desulfobaculum sp. SPO524 TaxID=3378071 RepID=UPI003853F7C4
MGRKRPAAAPQQAVDVAAPQESMKHHVFSMNGLRRNGWKIGYVAAGLVYAVLSQVYVPYAIRFVPLAVWGAGLVAIGVAGRRSGDALRRHRWKFGYIAAGLLFIPLSRLFVPFWVRVPLLAVWTIGLVGIMCTGLYSAVRGSRRRSYDATAAHDVAEDDADR